MTVPLLKAVHFFHSLSLWPAFVPKWAFFGTDCRFNVNLELSDAIYANCQRVFATLSWRKCLRNGMAAQTVHNLPASAAEHYIPQRNKNHPMQIIPGQGIFCPPFFSPAKHLSTSSGKQLEDFSDFCFYSSMHSGSLLSLIYIRTVKQCSG